MKIDIIISIINKILLAALYFILLYLGVYGTIRLLLLIQNLTIIIPRQNINANEYLFTFFTLLYTATSLVGYFLVYRFLKINNSLEFIGRRKSLISDVVRSFAGVLILGISIGLSIIIIINFNHIN